MEQKKLTAEKRKQVIDRLASYRAEVDMNNLQKIQKSIERLYREKYNAYTDDDIRADLLEYLNDYED